MKYALLISLLAFLSFSFYQNEIPKKSLDQGILNDSCFLKNIVVTTSNDTAVIDTTAFIFSYDKNGKRKRLDSYLKDGGYIYVIYEYDKENRITKLTDHYVLTNDAYGYSKGDIANRYQRRFKYKKRAKNPKHVKYLLGTAWQDGIRDSELEFRGKSLFKFNEKGQLLKIVKNNVGQPKATEEFTYDFAKNTIWIKSISHEKSGDIIQFTIENRYDKLTKAHFSINLLERYHLPHIDNYHFGNNIIYSKMVYGENFRLEKYAGKVAREFEIKNEYNENGFIIKSIKNIIDNFDKEKIGNALISNYEYICD